MLPVASSRMQWNCGTLRRKLLFAACWRSSCAMRQARCKNQVSMAMRSSRVRAESGTSATATIHLADVPLRDALARLENYSTKRYFSIAAIDPNCASVSTLSRRVCDRLWRRSRPSAKLGVSRLGESCILGRARRRTAWRHWLACERESAATLPERSVRSLREGAGLRGRDLRSRAGL